MERIGERIRILRRARGLSLRELARESGLSPSFISQLERGRTNAAIPSLLRITEVLGISIGGLLSDDSLVMRPQRAADRRPFTCGGYSEYVLTRRPSAHFEAYLCVLEPGATEAPEDFAAGDSEEFLYVISGTVHYHVGDETFVMQAGDAIEDFTSIPGRLENRGDETAEVFCVIGPPTVGRTSRGAAADKGDGRDDG